jgi:hypothetical protein
MTTSTLHESYVPIIDVINEIDGLLQDYSLIHGAPKAVNETLTDLNYLSDTLNYLEALFGDTEHQLHLPEPAQVITYHQT